MPAICPTCLQFVRPLPLRLVDETGIITEGNQIIRLTAFQTRFLRVLIDASPRVITRDMFLDLMYSNNEPERRTIDAHIGRLRQIIRPISLEILTHRSLGWSIVQTGKIREE